MRDAGWGLSRVSNERSEGRGGLRGRVEVFHGRIAREEATALASAVRDPWAISQRRSGRVELRCVESYRFRDGKVAEPRVYFDAFSMFTQLGIGAPAQGRAA